MIYIDKTGKLWNRFDVFEHVLKEFLGFAFGTATIPTSSTWYQRALEREDSGFVSGICINKLYVFDIVYFCIFSISAAGQFVKTYFQFKTQNLINKIQMQAMLQGSLSSQHISNLMQQQQLLANAAAQQQVRF